MVVYCQGFINYFQATELNLCCRGYIVLLQQDLKGEVLFVEAAPLDRHNCEEKQINLPRPTNLILCFFPSVSSSECFWNQNHSSFLWFPLFNFTSLSLFFSFSLLHSCQSAYFALILHVFSSTPWVSGCHTPPQISSLDVHTANESETHMGTPSHYTTIYP